MIFSSEGPVLNINILAFALSKCQVSESITLAVIIIDPPYSTSALIRSTQVKDDVSEGV